YSATKAVGMPLTPSLTRKPAFFRTPTRRAAERCSSSPNSAKVQMSWLTDTSSGRIESRYLPTSAGRASADGGSAPTPAGTGHRQTAPTSTRDAQQRMGSISGVKMSTASLVRKGDWTCDLRGPVPFSDKRRREEFRKGYLAAVAGSSCATA